ncbi:glycosyltransferase [Micromonospora yasonensis]|uniref:glycosyltransferase n=1 Tax=Micromonospora yasonensis TaxID=1128667 RepID=UPI0029F5681D|nr:hypothetical protein [Micromonospora yasonensis]
MTGGQARIVRVANFVTGRSGGLRTALRHLGEGYLAAGHEPVLVIPGARYADNRRPWGREITLPGPVVPGSGGYRVLTDRRGLARLLADLAPDRLEISDRSTLRWTGRWARANRLPPGARPRSPTRRPIGSGPDRGPPGACPACRPAGVPPGAGPARHLTTASNGGLRSPSAGGHRRLAGHPRAVRSRDRIRCRHGAT